MAILAEITEITITRAIAIAPSSVLDIDMEQIRMTAVRELDHE